ncbi:LacI family transcriptional regulator [Stenotrophomonas sp. ZAC14D2_NAIMI4_7]|uniref:LacI family DNA-binding transcriptional regulator n=1 Tax=Stenotrophomonas sp. ZAC14D2_NAIMI4_7 TaxID=2072405 RepID=UPI000D53D202|nr:LacI family DNA-binding transcriptional regulator [Stenotrophomonas sp. ZAC14D2_NAIMI4_7]AWH17678.1 LacI family transcriptional regulator [Stenotrophomonas sp. ZAC14D2_NAIMI4_7]
MPARRSTALRPPATLQTVADRVGVSTMTVSNVINGRGKVSAETRARVKEAIRLTGYIPNVAARRLAGAAGTRLGLLYPDVRSPFLTEVLLAALASANAVGAQLLVREGSHATAEHAEQLLMAAIEAGAEGLLLVPPYAELLSGSSYFQRLGMPSVAIAGATALQGMQTVRIDNRAAADQLTTHLVQAGHRSIGFITGPMDHGDSHERLQGYQHAMARHGLQIDPAFIRNGRFSFQSGCEAAEALLAASERPSAVLASNDDMALGVLWVAQRAGLRVPHDLAVVAFDDTAAARRAWPPLTVAGQPIDRMTDTAVAAIIANLVGKAELPAGEVVLPHSLHVRTSSATAGGVEV